MTEETTKPTYPDRILVDTAKLQHFIESTTNPRMALSVIEELWVTEGNGADNPQITVSSEPLFNLLRALIGPPHHISELQAISSIQGKDCPIQQLKAEYDAHARSFQKKPKPYSVVHGRTTGGNPEEIRRKP